MLSSLTLFEKSPHRNPYESQIPVLDIHAYNDAILISGGPINSADDWVADYPVQEADFTKYWSFHGLIGEDIILSSLVGNKELGEFVKIVWRAKRNFLEQISANP